MTTLFCLATKLSSGILIFLFLFLFVFRDGTIVSGDSLGHVQFWDGEMGTLLETFSSHTADVLTVAAHHVRSPIFRCALERVPLSHPLPRM